MLQGFARWPGLTTGVHSFSYTCSHGSGPGVATLVVPVEALAGVAPEGDLVFGDGVNPPVTLRGCRIDSADLVGVPGGRAVALHVLDRRWAWRFGGVSGYYNQRDPYPDPRPEGTKGYAIWEAQQIAKGLLPPGLNPKEFLAPAGRTEFIPGTERTPEQLMLWCLAAMYERLDRVRFQSIPADARPAADWQAVNPAQALQSVADAVAARLIFQPCGDTVLVAPLATARDSFALPTANVISDSPGLNPPDPPDSILCVGGPVVVADYYRLQAVGLEADGTVRPIAELSYTPAGGWGTAGVPGYDHWTAVRKGDSPDVDTSQALAKQFVWRTFRAAGGDVRRKGGAAGGDEPGKPYIPGVQHAEPAKKAFYQPVTNFPDLRHARQLILLDVEYGVDKDRSGQPKTSPAKLWGDSYKLYGDEQLKGFNRETPEPLDVSFTLDDRGLITTDQPVYKVILGEAGDVRWAGVEEANLFVRTSAKMRHPFTWQVISGQWESRGGGSPRPNVPPEVIRRPELQPVYDVRRNMRRPPERGYPIELVDDNLKEVAAAAAHFLAAHAAKYETVAGTTRTFAGLLAIDPDRAVQQVSWAFGVGSPPTTTIGVGTEPNPYVPGYLERRRIDAIASFVTENWVNQVLGKWQDGSAYK
jgi:hypothetical protein